MMKRTFQPDEAPLSKAEQAKAVSKRRAVMKAHEEALKSGRPAKWEEITGRIRKERGTT
jgi:hypothetical protein